VRMINELTVRGEPSEVAKLVERMRNTPPNGWKREPEIEERLKSMGAAPLGALCFSWPGAAGQPSASLFLHEMGAGELSVSNIVPVERRPLSDEEYNSILSEFERDVIGPTSAGIRVATTIIPPLARLEASLSPEALGKLRSFSSAANKSFLHPLDWRRWDRFLVQIHLDGSSLDDADLAMWLAEQGWTEPQFGRLIERFKMGQSLLSAYDEERFASRSRFPKP
jgi:hypothetical protein